MKQKQARAKSSARSWVGLVSFVAAVLFPLQLLAAETSPLLVTETELQVQYGKYHPAGAVVLRRLHRHPVPIVRDLRGISSEFGSARAIRPALPLSSSHLASAA